MIVDCNYYDSNINKTNNTIYYWK